MTRLQNTKCPECGARIRVDASLPEARCEYCGTVSRIEQRRLMEPRKQAALAAPTTPDAPPLPVPKVIRVGVAPLAVLAALLPFFIALAIGIGFTVRAVGGLPWASLGNVSTPGAGGGAGQGLGEHMQWVGGRQPMLAELTGDGVADVIGWVRFLSGGRSSDHLGAFDAVDGRRLWLTPPIADSSEGYEAKAALAGGLLVVADPRGVVRAFSQANGAQAWSAALGEKVVRFCGAGVGQLRAIRKDEASRLLTLANGAVSPGGRADRAGCAPLWTDEPGQSPSSRLAGGTFDNEVVQPVIEGLDVSRVVLDPAGGTPVALGARKPGTAVPMAAAYALEAPAAPKKRRPGSSWMHKPKARALWLAPIPARDPLSVREGAPEVGFVSAGRLLVPYQLAGAQATWRIAALDLRSGGNLWDAAVPLSETGDVGALVASDRLVFAGIWTYLHVLDLGTGAHRLTIGKW